MGLESIILLMEMCMKECGKRIRDMDKVFIIIQMERCIEGIINWGRGMELGYLIIRMGIGMREIGR